MTYALGATLATPVAWGAGVNISHLGANHKMIIHGEPSDGDIELNHTCSQRVFGASVPLGYHRY